MNNDKDDIEYLLQVEQRKKDAKAHTKTVSKFMNGEIRQSNEIIGKTIQNPKRKS